MFRSRPKAAALLILIFGLVLLPAVALAQEHDHDHAGHGHGHEEAAEAHGEGHGDGGDLDAQMQAMMKLAETNDHHAHMGKMVGKWKTVTKMWAQPGSEAEVNDGKTANTALLGGRFVQSNHSGKFSGMPFEGIGIEGYDNLSGKHVSMWIDSMGTMMMQFEGDCSDDHKTTTLVSDFNVPGMTLKMKIVTTVVDDDHYTMVGWVGPQEDQMFKTMEVSYTRN